MGYKKSTANLLLSQKKFLKHGKILDVGCGKKIYRNIFVNNEYLGIDIKVSGRKEEEKLADLYFDGENIPFEDNYFDFIICTEVLEHCANPSKLLSEIFRVLKIRGRALITVPFIWGEHEIPFDFRRYTSYGLEQEVRKIGFKIIKFQKDYEGFDSLIKVSLSEIKNNLGNHKFNFRFNLARIIILVSYKFLEYFLKIKAERIYLTNQIIVSK